VALLVLGLITLLSLVSWSRGTVTEWWIQALRRLVGIGIYGIPLALGAGGIWLLLRGLGREPDVDWEIVGGIAALSVLLLTLVHLLWPIPVPQTPDVLLDLAREGQGGGHLGAALGRVFLVTLGFWGSVIVLAFLILVAILWIGRISLADLVSSSRQVADGVRGRLHLPDSWSRRLPQGLEENGLSQMMRRASEPAPPLPTSENGERGASLINGGRVREAVRPAPGPQSTRIIGGEEQWEVPSIDQIFEDFSTDEISQP